MLLKTLKSVEIVDLLIAIRNVIFILISDMVLGLFFRPLSDRIATAFDMYVVTRAVVMGKYEDLDRVCLVGLINLFWCYQSFFIFSSRYYELSGQVFNLTSTILGNNQLQSVLSGKSIWTCIHDARVPSSIFWPNHFLL